MTHEHNYINVHVCDPPQILWGNGAYANHNIILYCSMFTSSMPGFHPGNILGGEGGGGLDTKVGAW